MDKDRAVDRDKVKKAVDGANRSEIHRLTGISLSGVSRILSGKRVARSGNLSAIALHLGVSMDDLYLYLTGLRKKSTRRKSSAAA